jgi:UDP-2,3-diacylglucosamine hydrolase
MPAARPVLVASDAHLGGAPPDQERAFLAWLERAGAAASWIILNGDLFDFWFEYRAGPTRGHDKVLIALRRIVDAGVPVTLMGGNHDWWGGDYLRSEIGVEFLQDPVVRTIAGRRALLAHGDGLGRGDLGYRILRGILRGRATRTAFGALPPAFGDALAKGISRTGRKWDEWGEHQENRSRWLARWAEERLHAEPELELVLLGHSHRPLLRRVRPDGWYVNTGDWVRHRSYARLEPGADPVLREWEGGDP